MKKELIILDRYIIKKLLKEQYSIDFLTDFKIKTEKLYNLLNLDFKFIDLDRIQNDSISATHHINEELKNSLIMDITIFEFESLYIHLLMNSKYYNLKDFPYFIRHLLLYKNIPEVKKYLNSMFGVVINEKSVIRIFNLENISMRMKFFYNKIIKEFSTHIIMIDTDEIHFRNFHEIKYRFEKYLTKLNHFNIPYNYKYKKFGMYYRVKHYFNFNENMLKVKDLKLYNKDGVNRGGEYITS